MTGNLLVRLKVKGEEPISISIRDNSYKSDTIMRKIEPGSETSVVLNLKQSHGWYDFTVKSEHSSDEAHYAGHVETWQPKLQRSFDGRNGELKEPREKSDSKERS